MSPLNFHTAILASCAILGLVPCVPGLLAATLNVPSKYATIQAAVDAAVDGDSVVVAAGSYTEPGIRMRGKRLSITGAGQDVTFLSSAPAIGFLIERQADVAVTGFDLTSGGGAGAAPFFGVDGRLVVTSCRIHNSNGGSTGGGAIGTGQDANVSCTDVLFIGNRGIAGAVNIIGGNTAHFTRCRFENNVTNRNFNTAGAANVLARDVRFVDCDFIGNMSVANFGGFVGGLRFSGEIGGTLLVERCLFVDNEGTDCGAILVEWGGSATIRNCTVEGNTGRKVISAVGVGITGPPTPTLLENCIVTRNGPTAALDCFHGALTVVCCDVWGNADDTVCPGGAKNIAADPQFCGTDRWDLQADSPCAPANSPTCGLIGSREIGCTLDSVEPTTWGRLKAIWRNR
jgi:hypothetical protein